MGAGYLEVLRDYTSVIVTNICISEHSTKQDVNSYGDRCYGQQQKKLRHLNALCHWGVHCERNATHSYQAKIELRLSLRLIFTCLVWHCKVDRCNGKPKQPLHQYSSCPELLPAMECPAIPCAPKWISLLKEQSTSQGKCNRSWWSSSLLFGSCIVRGRKRPNAQIFGHALEALLNNGGLVSKKWSVLAKCWCGVSRASLKSICVHMHRTFLSSVECLKWSNAIRYTPVCEQMRLVLQSIPLLCY